MRRNPLRPATKTMLPEDAGQFSFLSWSGDERRCYLKKAVEITYNKLKGQFLGQVQEIKENVFKLTLPEEAPFEYDEVTKKRSAHHRTVTVRYLGKGHFATAYLSEDKWVYLVVKHDARDQAKDLLVDFMRDCEDSSRRGEDWSKHIPYTEAVGFINRRGQTEDDFVYRMPYYKTISAKDKEAWKQLDIINKCATSTYYSQKSHEDKRARFIELIQNESKLPDSLKEALTQFEEHLQNYEEGWMFEFPKRNIGVDEEGNLVLRDVIFNQKLLTAQRQAEARRKFGAGVRFI